MAAATPALARGTDVSQISGGRCIHRAAHAEGCAGLRFVHTMRSSRMRTRPPCRTRQLRRCAARWHRLAQHSHMCIDAAGCCWVRRGASWGSDPADRPHEAHAFCLFLMGRQHMSLARCAPPCTHDISWHHPLRLLNCSCLHYAAHGVRALHQPPGGTVIPPHVCIPTDVGRLLSRRSDRCGRAASLTTLPAHFETISNHTRSMPLPTWVEVGQPRGGAEALGMGGVCRTCFLVPARGVTPRGPLPRNSTAPYSPPKGPRAADPSGSEKSMGDGRPRRSREPSFPVPRW